MWEGFVCVCLCMRACVSVYVLASAPTASVEPAAQSSGTVHPTTERDRSYAFFTAGHPHTAVDRMFFHCAPSTAIAVILLD
jgi:hypothetical protein